MNTKVTRLGGETGRRSRSGGRTATGATVGRAAQAYPTAGSAALAPVAVEPDPTPAPPRLRVAPPPPVPVPRAPFVVLVLVLVAAGVLGILILNTKINENAFILHDLRQEQAGLDLRQQQLEEEIAVADSAARLTAAARQRGMVETENHPYLHIPSGELTGLPEPAAGQPSRASQAGD